MARSSTTLGQYDPLNGEQYQHNPQKEHPCVEQRLIVMYIDRWNESTGATCARN